MCKDKLSEQYHGSDGDPINLAAMDNQYNSECDVTTILRNDNIISRYSMDKITNKRGKELLDLGCAWGLIIINGWVAKDKGIGKCTRIESNGKSVLDYMICSPGIMQGISDFAVCPKLPESYHLALTLSINCVTDRSGGPESSENSHQRWGWVPCCKYECSTADLHRVNETLTDYHSKDYHHRFIDRMIELENVDNVAMTFGNYINQACDRVCKVNQGNRSIGLGWYDTECRLKRAEVAK